MDPTNANDLGEIKKMIFKLNKMFTDKLLDQAYIIKQQQNRMDRQQQQLNHQRAIIDELAWQIRDVRDSLRKCSEQMQSKNHAECPENHLKINIPTANELTQSNHVSGRKLFSFPISFIRSLARSLYFVSIFIHSFVQFISVVLGNFHFVIEHNQGDVCAPPPLPPPVCLCVCLFR